MTTTTETGLIYNHDKITETELRMAVKKHDRETPALTTEMVSICDGGKKAGGGGGTLMVIGRKKNTTRIRFGSSLHSLTFSHDA